MRDSGLQRARTDIKIQVILRLLIKLRTQLPLPQELKLKRRQYPLKRWQIRTQASRMLHRRRRRGPQMGRMRVGDPESPFPWTSDVELRHHQLYLFTYFYFYEGKGEVVILITSNETTSRRYVKELVQIKKELEEKAERGKVLPVFAIANIHYDLQSTIRIKKFIGGYDVKGWPYPYPLLAYLHTD